MKQILLFLLIFSPSLANSQTPELPPTLSIDGDQYTHVVYKTNDAIFVWFSHDAGAGKIKISSLPANLQKVLGYDPQKEELIKRQQESNAIAVVKAQLEAQDAKLKQQALLKEQQAKKQQEDLAAAQEQAKKDAVDKTKDLMNQAVIVLEGSYDYVPAKPSNLPGVWVDPTTAAWYGTQMWAPRHVDSHMTVTGHVVTGFIPHRVDAQLVFIAGAHDAADGEPFNGSVYPTGTLVESDGAPYRVFAASAELALKLISEKGLDVSQVIAESHATLVSQKTLQDNH